MRRPAAAALFVCLAMVGCSNATPRLLAEGAPTARSFDVRLDIESRVGLVVVPVTVGGLEARFLLDSGAPTAIGPTLRRRLGLPTRERTRAADARRNEIEVDVVRLPELQVGGAGFADIAAVVLDVEAVPELRCLGVEGLLGANLMRQAAWRIDLEGGTLRFADQLRTLGVPAGAPSARFITLDSGSPLLRPLLDGAAVEDMVLDTGANTELVAPTSILRPEAARRALEVVGSSGAAALGYGSFAGRSRFARVRRIEIGDLTVTDRAVEFREEASLLGTRFLRDFVVTLDWRSRRVWFEPRPVARPPATGFGFDVAEVADALVVSAVIVDTAAWAAGLRPGQQLLALDGVSVRPPPTGLYCRIRESGLAPERQESLRVRWLGERGEREAQLDRLQLTLE